MTNFKLHAEPLQDSWLDAYGHLNEAYYLVPFTNTTWKLQDQLKIGVDYFNETGCALYTVETHLRYLDDVRSPALIEDGKLCATGEFMVLHYNTRESRTTEMPADVQTALKKAEIEQKPDWISRHISLVKK
jgi:acyl-CoA thioester hydrolase